MILQPLPKSLGLDGDYTENAYVMKEILTKIIKYFYSAIPYLIPGDVPAGFNSHRYFKKLIMELLVTREATS
jgi:hypothetical protein